MVFRLVAPPRHMDDLDPFYRQHRLLGTGIAVGGAVGLVTTPVALWLADAPTGVTAWVVAAWSVPVLAGLLHRVVGADLLQRRFAARMRA